MATPSVDEDVEDVEMGSDTTTWENSLAVSWNVGHVPPMWSNNACPRSLPERNESVHPYKDFSEMFTAAFFKKPGSKNQEQPKCWWIGEGIN